MNIFPSFIAMNIYLSCIAKNICLDELSVLGRKAASPGTDKSNLPLIFPASKP